MVSRVIHQEMPRDSGPLPAPETFSAYDKVRPRAVVWLIDLGRGSFDKAQGGPGFGAVVVEAGVETLEAFRVVKPEDGPPQQGEHLGSAGFLARARGVLLPQAGVAFPVVPVLHGPVAADGLCDPGRAPLPAFEAGDEVAGLAFDLVAVGFHPFAGDPHELARSGKGADVQIQIGQGDVAALDAPVLFFPLADPLVGEAVGQEAPGEPVEGGLVVLEAQQVVAAVADDYERRFFWQFRASPVTRAPSSRPAASWSRRRWARGSSQSPFLPL